MTIEHGTGSLFEQVVKEQLDEDLNKADTPQKKKGIIRRIIEAIKAVVQSSTQSIDEANRHGGGTVIPPHAKSLKEDAATPVLQLFHLLSQQGRNNIDPQLIAEAIAEARLTEAQETYIRNITIRDANSNTAAFLGEITAKVLENPRYLVLSAPGSTTPSELESDYGRMRGNRLAVERFRAGMIALAQAGKLRDQNGNAVSVTDVKTRFPEINTRMEGSMSEGERRLHQASVEVSKRIQSAFQPEKDALRTREQTLLSEKETIRRGGANSAQVKSQIDQKDTELSGISAQQIEMRSKMDAIESYLRYGDYNSAFQDEATIREYIRNKLAVSDAEIDQMRDVMQNYMVLMGGDFEIPDHQQAYGSLITKVQKELTKEEIYRRVWKNKKLDMNAVKEIQNELEELVSQLFEPLYSSPKSEFSEVFNPYVEGNVLKTITTALRSRIEAVTKSIAEDLKQGPNAISADDADRESRKMRDEILKERLVGEIDRRQSIEAIVHQYQQMGSQIELDKLIEIVRKYDITTLQEFYKDETTRIVSDLLPQFIQQLHIENGNEVITNLFQIVQDEKAVQTGFGAEQAQTDVRKFVVKYREEFVDYAYDIMMNLYREGQIPIPPNKKSIEARFSRAFLDNFLLSLRGIKVASRATPMRGAFDDIPFWHIIKGIFGPLHNWGPIGLRGRAEQGAGDAENYEVAGMRNFVYDEESFVKHWAPKMGDLFKDYHPKEEQKIAALRILYNIAPKNEELMKDLETGRWDVMQTMSDVFNGMAFGNMIDQAGFPFKGLRKNHDSLMKDLNNYFGQNDNWEDSSWQDRFQLYYRTAGVVPAFWLVGDRAGDEAEVQFLNQLSGANQGGLSDGEKKTRRAQFKNEKGKKGYHEIVRDHTDGDSRFDQILSARIDGKDQKVSFRDYTQRRIRSLRGEVFHQLLLKDPHAWLGEMVQAYPELAEGYVEYKKMDGSPGGRVKASDFYFNLDQYPDSELSSNDREKRDRFRFSILRQFRGTEVDRLSNVPHIRKIMDTYTQIEDAYTGEVVNGKTLEKGEARAYGSREMAKQLQFARKKAALQKQPEINREDVKRRDSSGNVVDERVYSIMYGQDGLVPHFEAMVGNKDEYFGDGEQNLGQENGFYQRWGRWEMTNRRILPEGDTDMDILTRNIENKQSLERRLQTDKAFADGQEVMAQIPSVCDKASSADGFDQWYGIIEEGIHEKLKVISAEDQMLEQQYQFEAFTAVCNYFMRDSKVSKMLLGFLNEIHLDSDVALSTIKAGTTGKFVFTDDKIYEYMKLLREKRYIKQGYNTLGGWGLETASLVSGANFPELLVKKMIYLGLAVPVMMFAASLKEAYDEQVEGDN